MGLWVYAVLQSREHANVCAYGMSRTCEHVGVTTLSEELRCLQIRKGGPWLEQEGGHSKNLGEKRHEIGPMAMREGRLRHRLRPMAISVTSYIAIGRNPWRFSLRFLRRRPRVARSDFVAGR